MEVFQTISLNIISAAIYSSMQWAYSKYKRGRKIVLPPAPSIPAKPTGAPAPDSKRDMERAINRSKLEETALSFFFYLASFYALYLSISMPPILKAVFVKTDIFLSDARFVGNYLPRIIITKNIVQWSLLISVFLIYPVLLHISNFLFKVLQPTLDEYMSISFHRKNAIKLIIFLLLCLPVGTISIWLFYEKTLTEAFFSLLFFLMIMFAIGQQGKQ